MPRLIVLAAALAPLAAACADELAWRVALPDAPADARTAFVAIRRDTLWMVDLQAPLALPALSATTPSEVAVTYYDAPPEDFGLTPGDVPEATPGISYLLPANAAWRATVRIDEEPAWQRLDHLPAGLSGRSITPTDHACSQFDVEAYRLRTVPGGAVVMPDGRVIVSDRDGNFWHFTRDGLTPLPELTGRPSRAVVVTPEGELWSFGLAGTGARGRIDERGVRLAHAPHGDAIVVAVGEATARGYVIHTLSARGGVASIDADGTWTTFDTVDDDDDAAGRALAQAGPGELLVTTRRSPSIRRVTATGVTTEMPDPDATNGYTLVHDIPELGTIVARYVDGQILVRDAPGGWRELPGVALGKTAAAVARDGDRVYIAGARGAMMELRVGVAPTTCLPTPVIAGSVETILVPAPDVLVLVSSREGAADNGVAWVERRRAD